MNLYNLVSLAGIAVLLAFAWLLSTDRRKVQLRTVGWGIGLQFAFGILVFLLPIGSRMFLALSNLVVKVLDASTAGTRFCFGPLAIPVGEEGHLGFILVFQALPSIVFFAALMEVLYFLRIMPLILKGFSWLFARVLKTSGAESLCAASNIFVGIESATTVRPFLNRMTRSEICTILTAGLATIASSVLGAYVFMIRDTFPNIAGHLISASLLSAPAALVMSKVLLPETGRPETLGLTIEPEYERERNVLEAIIHGATAGGRLLLGVVLLLLAFLGIVALVNMGLDALGGWIGGLCGTELSIRLENLLAYVFYPFTLIMGVPPADAFEVARLLGIRAIMTEIPAYQQLGALVADGTLSGRSAVLASYALCGFAHLPSMAIFIGGIQALAPDQTRTLSQVALRALLAATLACLMTAAVAGVFYGQGTLLLAEM